MKLNTRKLKYGTVSIVFIAVFIALVIAVNAAVSLLAERFPVKIDVTDRALNSLSDESIRYLERLEQDIEITVLASEEDFKAYGDQTCLLYYNYGYADLVSYLPNANEIIKLYGKYSDRITVRYVDILQDPTFAAQYPNDQLQQGQILIESDYRYKIVNAVDLFYINQDDYSVYLKAEKTITSAIMVTALEDLTNVQFVTGHNETTSDALTSLLEQNAYAVSTVNLSTADIDDETDILVLLAPLTDYTQEELTKLDKFLENNGRYGRDLFYFAAYNRAETPLLDSFMTEWGIEVSTRLAVESDQSRCYFQSIYTPVADYADETYGSKYQGLNTPFISPFTVPLKALFTESDNRFATELLTFPSTAYRSPANPEAEPDWTPTAEEQGPFPVAVSGKRVTYDGLDELASSVTVFGSYYIVDAQFLSNSLFTNAEYLLDVFNGTSEVSADLSIISKPVGTDQVLFTDGEVGVWGFVFRWSIPLVTLALSIVVVVLRRKK